MNVDILKAVEALAQKTGHVFIATADTSGQPHIAAAGGLQVAAQRNLAVTGWFCAETEANLDVNPRVALVVWDREFDHGYQVIGWREQEQDIAMLDGFAPEEESDRYLPQVERELLLRADFVYEFRHTLHTDEEAVPT
jgi:uncharacterized protein